jgi:hypothetical protein
MTQRRIEKVLREGNPVDWTFKACQEFNNVRNSVF